MPPRDSIPAMVEAQRRAATRERLRVLGRLRVDGRQGRVAQWYKRGLVVKDFQHPTTAGATRIADALYAALVR